MTEQTKDLRDELVAVEIALDAAALMVADLLHLYFTIDPKSIKGDQYLQAVILQGYESAVTRADIAHDYLYKCQKGIETMVQMIDNVKGDKA